MIKEIECRVSGRVQGVMYRDFVCRRGRRLGLVGTVENLTDGTVRVVAEGEELALRELIKRLWRGSLLARVEAVEVAWREASGTIDGFRMIR